MLRIASVVFALALSAGMAFASAELTGQAHPINTYAPDQTVCFSQTPGTCDGGTFVSAIVSQNVVTNCGTYASGSNWSADEFNCAGVPNGLHWWSTYFGDLVTCPPIRCAGGGPTFNYFFYLGGTTCPDPSFVFCTLNNQVTDTCACIGDDCEYTGTVNCPGGLPAGLDIYVSIQVNENAFPQWGWTESAMNLVGADPCLLAPGFGINTWTPIPAATGGPWCGQAFEVFQEVATPVESSSWGTIKGTFYND